MALYSLTTWKFQLMYSFFFFVSCHFLLVLMPIDKPIQEKANFEEQKQR